MKNNKIITENDFLIVLNTDFKMQYRRAIDLANNGNKEALKEANRLLKILADRINCHLGNGMDKPEGIEKQFIY